MDFKDEYKKYRWFYTSSDKLVIGGKSAKQNDELVYKIKKANHEFIVMHTRQPGSPFAFIIDVPEKVSKSDLEETAIFTGCFSRAWKLGKRKAIIDIFRASQLYKSRTMNEGTWGLNGKVQRITIELKLFLTKQKNVLRAVPEQTLKSKKPLLKIIPGNVDKENILPKISLELKDSFSKEEILSALPSGGIKVIK